MQLAKRFGGVTYNYDLYALGINDSILHNSDNNVKVNKQ